MNLPTQYGDIRARDLLSRQDHERRIEWRIRADLYQMVTSRTKEELEWQLC
jgi:hypothetical protein